MAAKVEGKRWVKDYFNLCRLQGFFQNERTMISIGNDHSLISVSWWPSSDWLGVWKSPIIRGKYE